MKILDYDQNYFCVLALLVILISGCGYRGIEKASPKALVGEPTLEDWRYITDPRVEPTQLPYSGGRVVISAVVTNPGCLQSVWAEIIRPDDNKDIVTLTGESNRYKASYQVLGNSEFFDQTYIVRIYAKEAANPSKILGPFPSDASLSIKVLAGDTPPPPPV